MGKTYQSSREYNEKARRAIHAPRPECKHKKTRIVTTPESEGRGGQVIDSMQVLCCTDCGVLVGVL